MRLLHHLHGNDYHPILIHVDSHHGNGPDGTGEITMTLPSLPQHSEHRVKLSLFIPSMQSTSSSCSLEDVAKSHDQTDQSQLYAWKHEVIIHAVYSEQTYRIAQNLRVSLISRISRIFNHLRNYFNEIFLHVKYSFHVQECRWTTCCRIHKGHSPKRYL